MSITNPSKDIKEMKRFEEILKILFEQGFGFALEKFDLLHHIPVFKRYLEPKTKHPGPERVRETFEKLGPTFIKFGQILSERPDIIPKEYAEELEKLQDSAPPVDNSKIKEIVDKEVGLDSFKEFSDEPIASASIAQVHRAELKSGEDVAVKVRRPGIKEKMDKDLEILKFLADRADGHFQIGNRMIYREVEEFTKWTKDELDLKKEGRNAQRFKKNLEDEERLKVPDVYMDHTTESVLVMEYQDTFKVTDRDKIEEEGFDGKKIAEAGLKSFLKQLLRDGFIHMDPHPSNLTVNYEGKLVYFDFGMMTDLTKETRRNIGLLILHTYDEDVKGVINILKKMSYVEEDADIDSLEREVKDLVLSLKGKTVSEQSISGVLIELATKSSENGVYPPTKFVLIGKGLVTMEGIGFKIHPDFKFDEKYQRLVQKLIFKNTSNPKDITRSFFIDLMENQESISKLPSKISQNLEPSEEKREITIENNHRDNLVAASLVLGSIYLLSLSTSTSYSMGLGVTGLIAAAYMVLSDR